MIRIPRSACLRSIMMSAALAAIAPIFTRPVQAQTLEVDTLALRLVLDENQVVAPLSRVARIEGGRVVAADLSSLALVRLPGEIGLLSALRSLTLADNLLDSLPAALWNLRELVQLDLGGNRIQTLDASVGSLGNLLFLGLRDNALAVLPASLSTLEQLETLILSGNALVTLPESLAELAFLRWLDASENRLASVPFTLAAMDGLDSLDLSRNRLEALPPALQALPATVRIRLGGNLLCALPPEQAAWASSRDPAWLSTQQCGSPVRRVPTRRVSPLSAYQALPGGLRVRLPDSDGGRILHLDARGRRLNAPTP